MEFDIVKVILIVVLCAGALCFVGICGIEYTRLRSRFDAAVRSGNATEDAAPLIVSRPVFYALQLAAVAAIALCFYLMLQRPFDPVSQTGGRKFKPVVGLYYEEIK